MQAFMNWEAILTRQLPTASRWRTFLGNNVLLIGEGPIARSVIVSFLAKAGIKVVEAAQWDGNAVIVGHEKWTPAALADAVRRRAGKMLKVYSHEMLFAQLALSEDIFDTLSMDELRKFGTGHPALEYLMNYFTFDWPSTNVEFDAVFIWPVDLSDQRTTGAWREQGVLRSSGYRVGKTSGLSDGERRAILFWAYCAELYPASLADEDYIVEWGPPKSWWRLRKMANSLAAFVRNAKLRRDAERFGQAIADWEKDLAWLRETFYESGTYRFMWPSTYVS